MTPNWSTRIYQALTWVRFKLMLHQERQASTEIEDLAKKLGDEVTVALAGFPPSSSVLRSMHQARLYLEGRIGSPLRAFSRCCRDTAAAHAREAAVQMREAVKRAILGISLRGIKQESAYELKQATVLYPKGKKKAKKLDLSELLPWADVPPPDYAEVLTSKFVGTSLDVWSKTLPSKVLPAMSKQLAQGMAAGESMAQIAKRLELMLDVSKWSAKMMARTAIQATANKMQDKAYRANKDLMNGKTFTATLDVHTCEICGKLDGKNFKWSQKMPDIPVHPGCRCMYVPWMKSAKDLGLGPLQLPDADRMSMDGMVPSTLKWKDWFKQPEVQDAYKEFKHKQAQKAYKRHKKKLKAIQAKET